MAALKAFGLIRLAQPAQKSDSMAQQLQFFTLGATTPMIYQTMV